jgi:molecular chaperone DnaK (HSP70)
MNGTSYEVVAVAGDEQLGGITFDNRLMDCSLKEVAHTKGVQCLPGSALIRLRQACENGR